jgi:hypothetical protein
MFFLIYIFAKACCRFDPNCLSVEVTLVVSFTGSEAHLHSYVRWCAHTYACNTRVRQSLTFRNISFANQNILRFQIAMDYLAVVQVDQAVDDIDHDGKTLHAQTYPKSLLDNVSCGRECMRWCRGTRLQIFACSVTEEERDFACERMCSFSRE